MADGESGRGKKGRAETPPAAAEVKVAAAADPELSPWCGHTLPPPEEASVIEPGLWQSGFTVGFPQGVQAVLCLCPADEVEWAAQHGYTPPALWRDAAGVPLRDCASAAIDDIPPERWAGDDPARCASLEWLAHCASLVHSWRLTGLGVLVKCAAGISRSTTVTCAYLMRARGLGWESALALVRERRPIAHPNPGFCNLLARYEAQMLARAATPAKAAPAKTRGGGPRTPR